jgi:hypothetical protein
MDRTQSGGFKVENTTGLGEMLLTQVTGTVGQPDNASEMEQELRRALMWLGGVVMGLWLARLEGPYRAKTVKCECGHEAEYVRKRAARLHTMFGEVGYRRAYYLCSSCHGGVYPLDKQLGLRPNAMSAELERLAGMMGVQMAFGKGSQVFEELTLVSLSDQSLDKAAQAYGEEMERQEAEWKVEAGDEEALARQEREVSRPLRLYGSLDGTQVHTRGEEENPWRELKIGAWFEARGRPPSKPDGGWRICAHNVTLYTDICPAEQFSALVWATGMQRHAHLARELIFLGDGADWIWNIVEHHFPHAVQIVDWFHACQYIAPVAHLAFKNDAQRERWIERVTTALWKGRLDKVIAACRKHVNPNRQDDPAQKAVTYYTNNHHRMDYPTYRDNGYHIGSGTVESAAKQIGTQRMKVPGAIWNLDSARKVAKARAAFLSNQWGDLAARRTHLRRAA